MCKKKKTYQLSKDDLQIWQNYSKHVRPIEKEQSDIEFEITDEVHVEFFESQRIIPKRPVKEKVERPPLPEKYTIDRKIMRQIRRGTLKIDAKLDLHGCSQEKAYQRLQAFLHKSYESEKKWLLVITGKGSGILRSKLPDWLEHSAARVYILAFEEAHQRHGGSGAYYICLRKKLK